MVQARQRPWVIYAALDASGAAVGSVTIDDGQTLSTAATVIKLAIRPPSSSQGNWALMWQAVGSAAYTGGPAALPVTGVVLAAGPAFGNQKPCHPTINAHPLPESAIQWDQGNRVMVVSFGSAAYPILPLSGAISFTFDLCASA